MKYYINKVYTDSFDNIKQKITEALKQEGFGVLTEIDMQNTFKQKLNVDFRKYTILGACNPPYAHRAIQAEDKIGTMLPCNIVLQEIANNKTELAVVDPVASMQAVENPEVSAIAEEIKQKLIRSIEALK